MGGGNNSNSPSVSYTDREKASNDIKNFTNANWLYEQYFGEYGLAEEFKPNVIDELKRVANGFALSYAQGKDTTSEIGEFQTLILSLQMSGVFNSMVTSLEQDFTNLKTDNNLSDYIDIDMFAPNTIHDGVSTELDEYFLDENKSLDSIALYETEQIDTIKKYNLPYPLDGKYPKYISLGRDMKGGGSPKEKVHSSNIRDWHFEPSMFIYKPGGVGHIAMVTRYRNCHEYLDYLPIQLVEATTDKGVVAVKSDAALIKWQNKYDELYSYSYQDGNSFDGAITSIPREIRQSIATCAKEQIGKKYNWNFFDKNDPNSTYCSQLVWQCYKKRWLYNYGSNNWFKVFSVDLDEDKGPIVFPSDLARHKFTKVVNHSVKR